MLIDELDRLRDEEVRTVAQLVRAVADFQHVSYVLAYDQRRVEEALGSDLPGDLAGHRERGRAYLEKLVHIPLPLPLATPAELRELLRGEVLAIGTENRFEPDMLAGERGLRLLELLTEQVLQTPREVVRATGAFRVLASMIGAEAEPVDLLAFAVLQTKFPDLYQDLRDRPNLFAPDLGTGRGVSAWLEVRQKREPEEHLALQFPGKTLSEAATALVRFLFPLPEDRDQLGDRSDTLRNRRALMIALRLGLPPGTIPRAETERFFRLTQEEALSFLVRARDEDALPDFLDRAMAFYPSMREPSDAFWPAVAEMLRRSPAAWKARYPPIRDSIEGFADLATARLRVQAGERARFRHIAEVLLEGRDPHILPMWLQSHALAYGMFGLPKRSRRGETAFLEAEELDTAMQRQADWVHPAFCDGTLFYELYNLLALHQLVDAGRWDAACSTRMQTLLAQPDGADQLALLGFGGHFMTERPFILRLVDESTFLKRMKERLTEVEGSGGDASLIAALRKSLGRD